VETGNTHTHTHTHIFTFKLVVLCRLWWSDVAFSSEFVGCAQRWKNFALAAIKMYYYHYYYYYYYYYHHHYVDFHTMGDAITLQAWRCSYYTMSLRLPKILHNLLIIEVVMKSALKQRPALPPGIISGSHFCYRLGRQTVRPSGSIKPVKHPNDAIGNPTHGSLACSSVLPPTAPSRRMGFFLG
jgi:hypothetical protein